MLKIVEVETDKDVEMAKTLVAEYADSLGFDLGFQDFEVELVNLPYIYGTPGGCILLAEYKGRPAGCIALRPLSDEICEMKRLYVKPEFRGLGIGRALADAFLEHAREFGYSQVRLDTVPSMKAARSLYKALGFKQISPYRYNPIDGAVFMELKLTDKPGERK